MDREDMRVAARVQETLRMLEAERGSILLLQTQIRTKPPGRPWHLDRSLKEEARLQALLTRQLRKVRVMPATPYELAVLAAGERIGRLGVQAWCNRVRKSGGPPIAVATAIDFGFGVFDPGTIQAKRMVRALIAEDAERGLESATGAVGSSEP
ncbi:hypothetical protein [Methylobacterium sp. yr668]|uniref:hypothetical protein n=1 Tax=Methylobacterium sp. yr668 TaxID=1761801 RepID=UPI0008E13E0E|nr:hypothetical protein [Methylobacterium sp. yr668]SFT29397.1 hypothetical protein SAMN04487845_15323 [Methylobacterium sp. yr668]